MAKDDIDTSSVVAGLWSAAWQYRWRTLVAVLLLVLAKVAGVVVPLVLKAIVDRFSHPETARIAVGAVSTPVAMRAVSGWLKRSTIALRTSGTTTPATFASTSSITASSVR